jgi:hypothetical protein
VTYPFVPLLSTPVPFRNFLPCFTFSIEQYSGEGCSTDVPRLKPEFGAFCFAVEFSPTALKHKH